MNYAPTTLNLAQIDTYDEIDEWISDKRVEMPTIYCPLCGSKTEETAKAEMMNGKVIVTVYCTDIECGWSSRQKRWVN